MTRPTDFDGWLHPEDDEPGAMPHGWWIIPGFAAGIVFWALVGLGLSQIGDAITDAAAAHLAADCPDACAYTLEE